MNEAPIRIFYDTEFTDFADLKPISIGLVTDDGRELYLERDDALMLPSSDFVVEVVFPSLGKMPGSIVSRSDLAYRLSAFIAGLGKRVILVSDSGYDWLMLHDLLWDQGRTLFPANANNRADIEWPDPDVYHEDQREIAAMEAFHAAANAVYEKGLPRHHALGDARALKAGFDAAIAMGEGAKFIAPWVMRARSA